METTELRFQTQQINAHRNRVKRQTNHLGVARDSITCLVDEAHQLVSSHADIAERLERIASDGAALAKYADKHEKPLGARGIQKALSKLRTGKPDSDSRREPSRQKDHQRYHNMLQGVKRG